MLIAMWLLRMRPGTHPDRYGPHRTHDVRRAVVAELREQYPGCAPLEIDVYSNGEIHAHVPPMVDDR